MGAKQQQFEYAGLLGRYALLTQNKGVDYASGEPRNDNSSPTAAVRTGVISTTAQGKRCLVVGITDMRKSIYGLPMILSELVGPTLSPFPLRFGANTKMLGAVCRYLMAPFLHAGA
ncbi:hypothetical protein [uncultured Ferrimonas sp.]|uniref:hypothetical protein n=1 Tax=uncultured Ferrimonas sp. TaxID=432640 RepID=UPI002614C203|nr:hypothetical protein [uncultured Ferrimonas sp.]